MNKTIRIPTRFIDDHYDRGLPTPEDASPSDRYAVIKSDDPALPELLSDAEHYAHNGPDSCSRGLIASAVATVRAIRDVVGWENADASIKRLRKPAGG